MFFNERHSTRHSRASENLALKSGVSLVTVLLFMLVATIAATATYKWLTSEGRSSASRMQQQEAYQSAVAGIESARSWMMYNANETGAIIKQYKDGNNAPVKLTDRLAAFMRAGQHYDVYLVGVNTENAKYKLKLLSEGTSRNGEAKHSEIAILNVTGLYQVRVPVAESHSKIKFDFNYFGGSTQAQGHIGAKSMLINGDLYGSNPVYAETDLIVTGNVNMTGNSVGADGTVCVGGSLDGSNGVFGNDFYIEGDARNFSWPSKSEAKKAYAGGTDGPFALTGNVYIEGNLEAPDKGEGPQGGQVFPKNFTLNGTWTTNYSAKQSSVTGNLCLGETGFIYMNSTQADRFLSVGGNVWMPGNVNMPGNISFWKGEMSGNNCTCNRYKRTCKKMWYGNCFQYNNWEIDETGVACSGNSSGYTTKMVVQNCDGELTLKTNDDNWATYEQILLGKDAGSKVYIKRAHTLADYTAMRNNTKASTNNSQIQACSGTNCSTPSKWKNYETHFPYKDDKAAPAGKPKPNYIYYMPTGTTDVAWGSYTDTHWNETIWSFFVNAPNGAKNSDTRYTDSHDQYGDCSDKPQSYLDGGKCYRIMNYAGGKITGSPYCKKRDDKKFVPECGVAPWFGSNGTVSETFPAEKPFECAESVKSYCLEKLGDKKEGCDGASYKVDDLLKTAYDSFEKYANKGCTNVTTWSSDMSTKLNTCYANNTATAELAKENLYNGYQVVKVVDNGKSDPKTELNGKFIIIVTNAIGQQSLPPTTADSYVFLYLPEGGSSTIQPAESGKTYNYFIYTEKDVGGFLFNDDVLSGSLYAKAENCAKVGDFKARKMEYNKDLVEALQDANILCDYDAASCGGTDTETPSSASSSESSVEYSTGGYDNYYIAVAPQLSVTLESQYKNTETVGAANAPDVAGSFIVLPRVIYLTKNAKGKLENYYNVIPLNTGSRVTSQSVSCNKGFPASGKLVPGDTPLSEGDYTCSVTGTIQSNGTAAQLTVPFWVRVKGEGSSLPMVYFEEPTKDVDIGSTTPVTLTMPGASGGGTQTCHVKITVTGNTDQWSVATVGDVEETGTNVYSATVTTDAPVTIFNVTNSNSSDGSISLSVSEADACVPGAVEVLYNANTAPIERKSIAEYCTEHSDDANCLAGGAYDKLKNHPDCETSQEWVGINGNSCSVSESNNRWTCGIAGAISLNKVRNIAGCEVVIAPVSYAPPLTANKEPPYYLYASIKKIPMTFHAGFSVEGDIKGDPKVKIKVEDGSGSREKECSYSDFKDEDRRAEKCDIMVYSGAFVTLSLEPENPSDFNYWVCESGADCPDGDEHAVLTYPITIESDDNTVYAHFGENDKHCFFDEFKEPTRGEGYRHNRNTIECNGETYYCIDYCEHDGNTCASNLTTSSNPNAKWRLVSASTATWNDLDYSVADGRIALKSSATRGKRESEKKKAIIMSSVQAGVYGTLKAQFQPPRQGVNASDVARATILNSGFILRSNPAVTSFLMLNIFFDSNGDLKTRICLNGDANKCKEETPKRGVSPYAPSDRNVVILVSATIGTEAGHDALKVDVYPSAWTTEPYSVTFPLTDEYLSGVTATATRPNEYVGYSLSDQNFKLYGIGWKSDSYRSECWDTPPTISCSFKARYVGGIVPKNESVKPWVGFSAWYDAAAEGCRESDVGYYYKGDDACGGTGTTYNNCGGSYSFSEAGAHGYMDGDVEKRMAKVNVDNCTVSGEEAAWARNGVAANCGSFWVGEQNACSRHHAFEKTYTNTEGEYFGLVSGSANIRGAKLKVTLDNPNGRSVEVYMFSQEGSGYTYGSNPIYSLPYQTNRAGTGFTLEISPEDLSNSEGFNVEKVVGVFVKTFGESSVEIKSITSECPNAVEIESCGAEYDAVNSQWNITAKVKNKSRTDKIEVTNNILTGKQECVYDPSSGTCKFTGDDAEFSWKDNPYDGHVGDDYSFKVTLTSKEGSTSKCTAVGHVDAITAKCISVSAPSVVQGKGLPQLEYSIANCPDTRCGYEISLVGPSTPTITSKTTSGNVLPSDKTDTKAANDADHPLDEGTYTFALISTNSARPFTATGCGDLEFEVNAPGAITATPCSFNSIVKGTSTATLSMANIVNVTDNTNITIHSGTHTITKTLSSGATSATFNDVPAPSDANSYEYTIDYTVNGSTKTICTATLNVLEGLGCSAEPSSIRLHESFKFTPTFGGSCSSASLSGNGTIAANSGSGCSVDYYNVTPNAAGDQTYTYTFSGDIGNNVTCQQTVTVTPPEPEFTCPTGWVGTVGSPVTLSLSPSYCDNNACTMKITGIDDDFVAFSSPRTFTDASATTSTNKYTIAIKNGTGTTSHDCGITYSTTSSTYRADCWFDKNGKVTTTPTGYQYTNFKVKTISGFPSNTSGKVKFNGKEYDINLYTNGNTSDYSNLPMPNTAGSYPFEVVYNSEKVCEGSITVADPVTCSVNHSAVTSGSSVTFTAAANTSLSSTYSLDITSKCGFKINGNWKDGKSNTDQGLSSGTHTQQVNAKTEFTFACNNNYSCSKTVVLANPPEIACAALTRKVKTGDPVSIKPTVEYCENNCEWHISGYENLDHNTRDWSSGGTIGLSTVNSDGAKNYRLTVENDYGHDDCDFTLTYSSGVVCHCKCTNGCPDNVITTGWDGSNTGGCYFVTAFKIGAWNSSVVEVNGNQTFTNTEKSDSDYPTKVDGGYYIQFRSWYYPNISTFTAAEPTCN